MVTRRQVGTRCGGLMTEAQFLAWVRSALRSKSLRWPPRMEAIKEARRPYNGPNKLQKWEVECAICHEWHKLKDIDVDHFPKAAGSIRSIEDIGEFVNNLYCEKENLRVLCKPCHKIHTLSENAGITFEEAMLEKRVTEQMKSKDLLAFLEKNGYTGISVSNVKKRREAVFKILSSDN